jgi:hypothetical protein
MRKEYDFSKAVQGKFYRPLEELSIPVYLDKDVAGGLRRRARKGSPEEVASLVNRLLRKELEILDSLAGR